MSELAFLGTGTMGLPMVRNLLAAGFSVRAWNRSAERAAPLRSDGAEVYDDPAAASEGCTRVITMLSDAEAVLETAERALPAASAGATWIQMSTIGVDGTQRCTELAAEHDVTFVDAPVLGTRAPAEQGKLIVLASGPEAARETCAEIFDAVGGRTDESHLHLDRGAVPAVGEGRHGCRAHGGVDHGEVHRAVDHAIGVPVFVGDGDAGTGMTGPGPHDLHPEEVLQCEVTVRRRSRHAVSLSRGPGARPADGGRRMAPSRVRPERPGALRIARAGSGTTPTCPAARV